MRQKRFYLGSHSSLWLCLLSVAFAAALLSGCGGSGRTAVEGTVTLDGKPLQKGRIRFCPRPGTASPSAGAKISEGHFSLASEEGLLPGEFHVEITATRPGSKKFYDRFSGKMVMLEDQYLPQRYNKNTQLQMTIPSQDGTFSKDFELTNSTR